MKKSILKVFILFCVTTPVKGQAQNSCSNLFQSYDRISRLILPQYSAEFLKSWDPSNFSDPLKAPKEYRYIVHAIRDQWFLYDKKQLNKLNKLNNYLVIDFVVNGEVVSTSLISYEKNATVGMSGFIMTIPAENILAADSEDLMTMRFDDVPAGHEQSVIDFSAKNNKLQKTPDRILSEGQNNYLGFDHSEVAAITRSKNGSLVKISGIFIKTDSFGNKLTDTNLEMKLIELSKKGLLPIVYIPPPKGSIFIRATKNVGGKITLHCSAEQYQSIPPDLKKLAILDLPQDPSDHQNVRGEFKYLRRKYFYLEGTTAKPIVKTQTVSEDSHLDSEYESPEELSILFQY